MDGSGGASFHRGKQSESLVLVALHDLAFARSLVIDAAQMEHSVDYHAEQFIVVSRPDLLGIGGHGVERTPLIMRPRE